MTFDCALQTLKGQTNQSSRDCKKPTIKQTPFEMVVPRHWRYKLNNTRQKYKNQPVFCVRCHRHVPFNTFKAHVATSHPDVPKTCGCEYCFYGVTWPHGHAGVDTFKHRIRCIEKLMRVGGVVDHDAPCYSCHGFHLRVENQRHYLFGRPGPSEDGDSFYEPMGDDGAYFEEIRKLLQHVSFTAESGLGNSVFNIFDHFDDYKFYHLVVRRAAWDQFTDLPFQGVYFTRYWCLCDHGKCNEDTTGDPWHRHMVVMVHVDAPFEKEWPRVKVEGMRCKLKKHLKTRLYLVNALHYVSKKSATDEDVLDEKGSHFWINTPMIPHAKLFMGGLYPDGVRQVLYQQVRYCPVQDSMLWESQPRDATFSHPHVAIENLGVPISNCVLPLARGWQLGRRFTDAALCMGPTFHGLGTAYSLVYRATNMTNEEWFGEQLRKGNCLLNMIHAEHYEMTQQQTKEWQVADHVVDVVEQHAQDYEKRKLENPAYEPEPIEAENRLKGFLQSQQTLRVEHDALKRRVDDQQTQVTGLREQMEAQQTQLTGLRDQNTKRQAENVKLKSQMATLVAHVKALPNGESLINNINSIVTNSNIGTMYLNPSDKPNT